jgi:Trk K+ transport system NAD-binding subunit
MTPTIIVYGLDTIGYRILCLLRNQNATVVGVNDHPLPSEPNLVIGDLRATSTLEHAGIGTAQILVIANGDDALNLDILLKARLLNPRIRIVNRLFNASLGDRLDHTLAEHTTLSVADLAAPIFTFAALGKQAIGHLQLFGRTWPISEEYIDAEHPWCNRAIRDLWPNSSRMLIHYLTSDTEISLVEAMSLNLRLQAGDRLIVGTQPHRLRRRASVIDQLKKLLHWLGQFQRYVRSGLLVTLVLLLTIVLATFTYLNFGWAQSTFADALYFSVGMITGAGGNEAIAERASTAIKIFTVIMMLLGAGVIGVFYALLNDLVLGSRLRQFWDVARIPHRNHYIVCGLGGVGVRVVNQLLDQGHEVVVIEQDSHNRFLSMVRAQHVPVVLADATLPLTLKTAHITQAQALIAVTNNDMSNLEVALTAKQWVPNLSVIVRSNQPEQASLMQQVFDFTAVLSPFDIAAPAFAAAALGGQVLGSGVTGNILWIALSLLVTPAHPFCGQSVQDVAIAADLVPLYLETSHQTLHGWDLLQVQLSPGDVLRLTIPAINIDRLWQTHAESIFPSKSSGSPTQKIMRP